MVLSGKRELRSPYVEQCIKNLGLKLNERLYFEAMLRSESLSSSRRRGLLLEVQLLSSKWLPPEPEEGIKMLDYGLVHQALSLAQAALTVPEIMARFRYPVDRKTVEAVLLCMIDHEQVTAIGDRFRLREEHLIVKNEMPSLSARNYHRDSLRMAESALADALDEREFQTYLLTVDSRRIPEMKAEIRRFTQDFIARFNTDLDSDTAIQFHGHFFKALAAKPSETP